jgi:LacI family transcriptional regulator
MSNRPVTVRSPFTCARYELLDKPVALWYNFENVTGIVTGIVTSNRSKHTQPMSRTKATVTIRDVAETAGVSVSTVSRVLNNKDDVAPETYQKVQGVIDELGYTSSLAARGMRSRRMNVIGLVMPDVGDPFSIQVMKGVNRAIAELDYDLIVYTGGEFKRESAADRERRFVSLLGAGITDGVIVVTPVATSFPTASPVVVVDPNVETHDCPAVIATNRDGALAAVEYLISLGHRRIGFISGRPELQSAVRRLLGYKDGLRQADIPLDPDLIQTGDYSRQIGFACAQRLLNLSDPPTAIFASNDQSATGAIQAIHETGLRVPDDISVVGFDNIPEVAHAHPGLTTVDQSIDKMGYIATEMLISLIEGDSLESDLYKVPTQLIVRDSCRAIAGHAPLDQKTD